MQVTYDDKDKNQTDGVHNKFRDIDANEIKQAVNSKVDTASKGQPGGVTPLNGAGQIDPQYINLDGALDADNVDFTPSGNLAADNVGDALRELDTEKQPALGFTPENAGNKATNLSDTVSNTKYPTVKATVDGDNATLAAAKAYTDSAGIGGFTFCGSYDPNGATVYPTTGGTGTAGAIEAGNAFEISAPIAAGGGHPAYDQGDIIVAKFDAPGQTSANWGTSEHNTAQATELVRGTAFITTQAIVENKDTTDDEKIVTPLKYWQGINKFLTLAWTFVLKITFTAAPRFSSVTANQYLKVDGSKDLTSVSSIPGADVAAATDTTRGTAELATDTEAQTGTDTGRIVTPGNLQSRLKRFNVCEFPADLLSTANIPALSGIGMVIQGVVVAADKVVIVAAQTDPLQNGLYLTVNAGAWLRIGAGFNNNLYPYNGNFEGLIVFNRNDNKIYYQSQTVAQQAATGQVWVAVGEGVAGSVETFASNFAVQLTGGKTFGKYSNGQTVPAAGKTPMQLLLDIAIEYLLPTFSAFGITGLATQVEVGFTITSGAKTFTWATTNSGNINANTVKIRNQTANTDLATALANDGTESVTVPAPIQLNAGGASQVFRVEAVNSQSVTFNRDLTIVANFLRWFGTPATTPVNSADVRALGNSTFGSTFNINIAIGQQKIAFAYEDTRADISDGSVKYVEGFNSNVGNTFTKFTFNVNDAGGTARGYKIYVATLGAPASSAMTYAVTIP
jgi:hypothetical protein